MPYQVLALKWRPRNFDEVIGQEHITTTLANAISSHRLANAYLFTGPHGVGKTSVARILAKSLNCKDGPTVNPCQKCPSCVEISQSRNLDVIEIDGASNRGIDEIRTLRENVKFSPVSGKFKIYIIDEVHMLTTEAFNALLKTLEEPPEFVKFIFATTQPNKVPPTILSRCQRFNFKRIQTLKIVEQLKKILGEEKLNLHEEVIFAIAKASEGSLRDAESILDQLASFNQDKLSMDDVVSVLGVIKEDLLFGITEKAIKKDTKGVLELLGKIIDDGKDVNVLLAGIIEHFRNLIVAKVSKADTALLDLPEETCDRLYKQSQAFSLQELIHFFNILVNTQEMAKRFLSPRIPIEISLIKLTQEKIGPTTVVGNPPVHINSIPSKLEKENPPQAQRPKEDSPAKECSPVEDTGPGCAVILENVKNCWQVVIDNLKGVKMSVATYLSEGEPAKFEGGVLTVSFPKTNSFHKEILEREVNKVIIEKVVKNVLNINVKLNFVLSKEEPHREKPESSDFLKSVLETFNAKPANND